MTTRVIAEAKDVSVGSSINGKRMAARWQIGGAPRAADTPLFHGKEEVGGRNAPD